MTLTATIRVDERPMTDSKTIAVVATVTSGGTGVELDSRWRVLSRSLLGGSRSYTRRQLYEYGSQAGPVPDVVVGEGFMQVRMEVPAGKSGLSLASDFLFEFLTQPTLREEDIAQARHELAMEVPSAWSRLPFVEASVTPESVRALHRATFKPSSVRFAVVGGFGTGEATFEFNRRFGAWTGTRAGVVPIGKPTAAVTRPDQNSVFRWETRTPVTSAAACARGLLVACSLGAGKDASLFRIVRQQHRWGYEQAAGWRANGSDWSLTAVTVQPSQAEDSKVAEAMRAEVAKDIERWDASTLERAKQVALACLAGRFPMNPIGIGTDTRFGSGLMSEASLVGISALHGRSFGRAEVGSALGLVDLAEIQADAKRLLASPVTIQAGRPPVRAE